MFLKTPSKLILIQLNYRHVSIIIHSRKYYDGLHRYKMMDDPALFYM